MVFDLWVLSGPICCGIMETSTEMVRILDLSKKEGSPPATTGVWRTNDGCLVSLLKWVNIPPSAGLAPAACNQRGRPMGNAPSRFGEGATAEMKVSPSGEKQPRARCLYLAKFSIDCWKF